MGNSGQRLPTLFGVGVIRFFDCTWLLEGTHKEEFSRWKVRVVNLIIIHEPVYLYANKITTFKEVVPSIAS